VTFTTDRQLVQRLKMGGAVPSRREKGQLYFFIFGCSMLRGGGGDARSIIE